MTVCSGTLEHVELALLEGSELSSAVQAHLTSCSACAAQAESLKGIVAALQASPAPVAPASLTARLVPLVLAEAQKGRRQGVFTRVMRPVAAFATAFGAMVTLVVTVGTAFVVAAAITGGSRLPSPEGQAPTNSPAPAASEAPATPAPATEAPASDAPATEAPSESAAPEATPTPEPTDVPRRTPEPVSPDPSTGSESTAPTEGTSP
jgi:anti-sigma factor RsiW